MRMYLGKFIRGIEECDSENIICPIEGYDRYKYLNRRLLIRVLLMIPYGYNFGYNLASYKSIEDIKIVFIKLIVFYLISFYLIQIPHEFIHCMFYKHPLKSPKNSLIFFNNKRIVTSELNEYIHPIMLIINLITPFILFSIFPLILNIYLGFNLYLYALSFANSILSSDDLLNIILQFFVKGDEKGYKRLYVIPNNYDYLIKDSDGTIVDEVSTNDYICNKAAVKSEYINLKNELIENIDKDIKNNLIIKETTKSNCSLNEELTGQLAWDLDLKVSTDCEKHK